MTRLLDTNAAAKMLGYTPVYIRRLSRQGRLPSSLIGGSLVFRRADLEAFTLAPRGNPNFQRKRRKRKTA